MMINTKINRENYFEGNDGSSDHATEAKGWSSLWKTVVPIKDQSLSMETCPGRADVASVALKTPRNIRL
jgi:hypothetical protein